MLTRPPSPDCNASAKIEVRASTTVCWAVGRVPRPPKSPPIKIFPPPQSPEASRVAPNKPTRLPKIWMLVGLCAFPRTETSPLTIASPTCGSIWVLVRVTVPSGCTVTLPASSRLPPVSSSGKERGVKLGFSIGETSKLRRFSPALKRTRFSPGMAARVMFPPGADRMPSLRIVPPSKLIFSPGVTASSPKLAMLPGFVPSKRKALGSPTKFAQE